MAGKEHLEKRTKRNTETDTQNLSKPCVIVRILKQFSLAPLKMQPVNKEGKNLSANMSLNDFINRTLSLTPRSSEEEAEIKWRTSTLNLRMQAFRRDISESDSAYTGSQPSSSGTFSCRAYLQVFLLTVTSNELLAPKNSIVHNNSPIIKFCFKFCGVYEIWQL